MGKEISSKIHYKQEGYLYNLKYEHKNCSFEILVNDIPVVTHFVPNSMYISQDINKYILKPGKQEITIRLFPQKIDSEKFEDSLSLDSQVKIKITKDLRNANPEWAWTDDAKNTTWTILEYETPKIEAGKNFAEYKTSIELSKEDVGWQLVGWSESQDLSNDPKIKEEVGAFYDDFIHIVETKNYNKYIKLSQQNILEDGASHPWDHEGVKDLIESYRKSLEMEQESLFLNKDQTEIKFYGNGRVVTLISKAPKFFGYPPLMSQGKKDRYVSGFILLLHKPKGSNQLEIIR